ncbi:hypothetical protein BH10BAC2_BH10BAC2_25990 [soil metagenome]
MFNWFKNKRSKENDITKMFGYPPGIFLYVKDKYKNAFTEHIKKIKDKQIYKSRVFLSSFEEVSQYPELENCDFSGERFEERDNITKYWIVSK